MTLMIGSEGWHPSPWLKGYFPDDIPKAWQLDYYSNDFSILLIKQESWLNSDTFIGLIEESEPCKILLKVIIPFDADAALSYVINKLGVHFYGIVVEYDPLREDIDALEHHFSAFTSRLFLTTSNHTIINKENYKVTVNTNQRLSLTYYYATLKRNYTMHDLVDILHTLGSGILIINTPDFNALQNIITLKQSIL